MLWIRSDPVPDPDATIESHKTRKKSNKLKYIFFFFLHFLKYTFNPKILNKKQKIVNKSKQSEF